MPRARAVGKNVLRKEGFAKVTGRAQYVADLSFADCLFARTIRSTIPHGDIVDIRFNFDRTGFTIVDHHDIPGRNIVALIDDDQPCLAADEVRHVAEPIVLLAHSDRERLEAAEVEIRYRQKSATYDPVRSTVTFKTISIDKGDIDRGMAAADAIVDGEYRVGHQEQLYIEPNGVIAVPGADGGITVYGSLQCPYYVHRALMVLLGFPAGKVRVIQTETGGGFGGKEEYPSMIAGHAALLALKTGRPVTLIYDRVEDMLATTKRHPAVIRHRTGVSRDGRLTAIDIDAVFDGGAYSTLSAVVLSRGLIHASGPYRCEHVRIRGRAVMTNTPPNGAFRGFGAPQTQFAVEVHMDRIAEQLGLDPFRIREINALRPGDVTATGQRLGSDCSALQVLRAAVKRTDFRRKRRTLGQGRGIGLSLFFHGSGFTGAGEVKLASKASLALTDRGARILVGSTEIGQGTSTMLAQIVADGLDLPYDAIEVNAVDTSEVPDSGPTVASRTCLIVGRLLQQAAEEMRRRLARLTPREYLRRYGPLVITAQYQKPEDISWDDNAYRGDAYESYGWGCDVVEVEVDPITWQGKPVALTTVHDIGKAIHPTLAAGQIEGGTAQGIGYALLEEVAMRDGRMANSQLTNYIIPTTLDTPRIDVVILENAYPRGPFGAKGVGEMPIDGPAPAIVNALRHAGFDLREIPATPEKIMGQPSDDEAKDSQTSMTRPVIFTLNGARARVAAHPMKRLLDALREDCRLTGTKEGCGEGECGACTVLIDGRPVNACLIPLAHVRNRRVTTIEGLNGRHPLQRAFVELGGAQCGICTPGMILAAMALGRNPSGAQMRTGLAGNLCRCTGYAAIYRSIQKASRSAKRTSRARRK